MKFTDGRWAVILCFPTVVCIFVIDTVVAFSSDVEAGPCWLDARCSANIFMVNHNALRCSAAMGRARRWKFPYWFIAKPNSIRVEGS